MTKKEMQKLENQLVENAYSKMPKIWIKVCRELGYLERLDFCQAWVYQTKGYTYLISYNTIVAFIDDSGNMFDVLRMVYGYTATSAKHISKFRSKFRHVSEHTWREL